LHHFQYLHRCYWYMKEQLASLVFHKYQNIFKITRLVLCRR
jgi:hypothetical protein